MPTVWVDTNVMIGLWTHGDLLRPGEDIEKRRIEMQENLWMAMALCRRLVTSLTYAHEVMNVSERVATPEGDDGVWIWTSLFAHCLVVGGLLDGWTSLTTDEAGDLGNGPRDTHMVDRCAQDGLILVHRDDGAGRKARNRGVREMSPRSYAEAVMPWDEARTMLTYRLNKAVNAWPDRHPVVEQDHRRWEATVLWELYLKICEPAGEPR